MNNSHRKSSLQRNQNLLVAGYSLRNKKVNNVDLNSYQLVVRHFNLKFVCCERGLCRCGMLIRGMVIYSHISKTGQILVNVNIHDDQREKGYNANQSYQYLRSQNASLFTFPVLKNVAPKTK